MLRSAVRRVVQPRTLRSETALFTAPIAGWIANRSLGQPEGAPQGAVLLRNFFPTATGAILRRGRQKYAHATGPVMSLFKYVVGNNQKLFVASADTIWDISTSYLPEDWTLEAGGEGDIIGDEDGGWEIGVLDDPEARIVWSGAGGGRWSTVQFSTTGGTFLIGVNGESTGFIFDGTDFWPNVPGGLWLVSYSSASTDFTEGEIVTGGTSGATGTVYKVVPSETSGAGQLILAGEEAENFETSESLSGSEGGSATSASAASIVCPGISFGDGSVTIADMSFVWVYKNTLWFAQKESLTAWYMLVDQIGGEAKPFPLGAEFGQGGSLLIGQSWSMSSSGQGGLSEQNVFVSTEGEVVVYQGLHPDAEGGGWAKVGTYRIGRPLGPRAFIRAGGDLVFATTIGFVALSTAIQVDQAALAPRAVSFAIEDEWNEAVRGRFGEWVCCLWPEGQMVAVVPPTGDLGNAFWVSNARTGAWAAFTNWTATCIEVFQGRLFFGMGDYVMEGMVGGTDDGDSFTGVYVPLFSGTQKPAARKYARMVRAELLADSAIEPGLACLFDFDLSVPAPPSSAPVAVGEGWDSAIWGESVWSAMSNKVFFTRRASASGSGFRLAPVLQITSGQVIPLDASIIAVDVLYETGAPFA